MSSKIFKRRKAWFEDEYFRGYCERHLSIIGEAASKLVSEYHYDELYPDIEWALIKGMRTILVHVYWKTDPKIVWDIVDKHLPQLEIHLDKWLKHKKKELKTNPPEKDPPTKESKLRRKLKERYQKGSREYYTIREAALVDEIYRAS